jgi:EDD domain protein, DegV family
MIMLVKRASEMRAAGEPMEKAAKWIEDNRLNVVHWFTVDDLQFLKRGGRLSGAAALVGTMLSVKPILHVDEEGKLVVVDKVRGRKSSITRLVDEMEKKIIDSENQTIYIAHADCIDDAQLLADEIKKRTKIKDIVINFVGPVIGGHSGPNTLALIFFGKNRAVD